MIVLVTKKLFMRSKVKNYVFWTFDLIIVLVTKKLFMRSNVKNYVYWTFDQDRLFDRITFFRNSSVVLSNLELFAVFF